MLTTFEVIHREKNQWCAGITCNQVVCLSKFCRREGTDGCIGFIAAMSCVIYFERGIVLLIGKWESDLTKSRVEFLVGNSAYQYTTIYIIEIRDHSITKYTSPVILLIRCRYVVDWSRAELNIRQVQRIDLVTDSSEHNRCIAFNLHCQVQYFR